MLEFITPNILYSIGKDVFGPLFRKRRKLSQSEVVALRKKWKAEFEPRIWEMHQKQLRRDVIIRDMKRVDNYPDLDEKARGISPWFRAGLAGTYHKGLLIGLTWTALSMDKKTGRLRKTDHDAGEAIDFNAILIGSLPYENIENVDWDGDEFYNFPQIYSYFMFRREPYQHIAYYEETKPPHGIPLYKEVAAYKDVRRLSKKRGIKF